MAPSTDQGQGRGRRPPPDAILLRRWGGDEEGRPTTILARHPTAPFVADIDRGRDGRPNRFQLRQAARDYLAGVADAAPTGLPAWWLDALVPARKLAREPHPDFGWLPLARRAPDGRAIGSSLVRTDPVPGEPSRTVVLFASERDRDTGFVLGSEFGIRVVAHLRDDGSGVLRLRITGFTASLPFGDFVPSGGREAFWTGFAGDGFVRGFFQEARGLVGAASGLDPASIFFRGVRLGRTGEPRRVELRGRGLPAVRTAARSVPHEFIATLSVGADKAAPKVVSVAKEPLVACMSGTARVLRCDPASMGGPRDYRKRRPTRREQVLDGFRDAELEAVPLDLAGRARVEQTWFVLGDDPPSGDAKEVVLPHPEGVGPFPPVRSNDFSAVSAFRNLREIFRRFELYGISPADYFNLAALPIKAFYRSGIVPGPGKDGQTVNARVLPEGWNPGAIAGPTDSENPVALQIHMALGDLSTRARAPWDGANRSPAQPLGIAADPNWMWHEAAHVLMMATLGQLEFQFAHSAGDALAAIVADPRRELGDDPARWDWRFHTFPWVFLPRRHDRCVLHGWGWRGSLGRAVRRLPDADRLRRKGYWTEQILSTTLFRLYRCLGGDTVLPGTGAPDRAARKRASDYTVYLIMEGLRMLGDQRFVPATHADLFAAALGDADTGTETCPTDDGQGDIAERVGGCAHKVVEWAFAAQGAGPGGPEVIDERPGPAPAVDIYIRDRRPEDEILPAATVPHGPGTYVPVSLDWVGQPPAPLWFAEGDAIREVPGGIEVTVANRGTAPATAVTVTVRWRAWPAGQDAPPWKTGDAEWRSAAPSPLQNIAPGAAVDSGTIAPPLALAAGRYIVLAQADCAEDRSNIHPETGLACTRNATPLNELVPFDNNLGLRTIQVP